MEKLYGHEYMKVGCNCAQATLLELAEAAGLTKEEAMKMASRIAGNAPIAVRACKKAVNDGLQVDMDQALVVEEKLFGSCFETEDQKNAMGAFVEKRKPEPFVNR